MSLRLKLILAFLVLSVVPLAATTWYSYAGSARALREAAERESDLLAGELTQRMQLITAELGDRMERLADMEVESAPQMAAVTAPVAPPSAPTGGTAPKDADPTAAAAMAASATLESTVAQALGEAAMLLNNVEFRGVPSGRGRAGPPAPGDGRASRGRSTDPSALRGNGRPPDGPSRDPARGRARSFPRPPADPSVVSSPPPAPPVSPATSDPAATAPRAPAPAAPAQAAAVVAARTADEDNARVTIDLMALRRRMFRELSPDRPFDQMTPEERQRVMSDVNQRLLGVMQGIELGAAELQKQAEEAKRKADTPPVASAVPAPSTPATRARPTARKRTLSGDRLDVSLEHGGPGGFVQHINAQVNLPDVLATIFSATRMGRGELPFAIGRDGRLYTALPGDRAKIEALGAGVISRETKPGTTRLPEWIVATTDDPNGSGLRFGIARPVGDALQDLRTTAARNAGLGLLFICVTLVGIVPLSTGLTKNVSRLSEGVRKIAGGDYGARVAVTTKDEMGDLARAFNQMSEDVERHQHTALQQERIKRELELGRQIQHEMLPRAPLRVGLTELDGVSVPAGEVGGDFYNYFTRPDGHIALLIGDVSGKGVGAALLMATVQASLRTRLSLGQDLVTLMDELDRDIDANTPGPVYATLLVGLLDPSSGVLRYVNAGHPLPLVMRKHGAVEHLETSGLPIGMLGGRGYTEARIRFSPGDLFFGYTDGCVEVENERGEPFGTDALERALTAANPMGCGALLAHMDEVLRTFRGDCEPLDDATMLAVSIG